MDFFKFSLFYLAISLQYHECHQLGQILPGRLQTLSVLHSTGQFKLNVKSLHVMIVRTSRALGRLQTGATLMIYSKYDKILFITMFTVWVSLGVGSASQGFSKAAPAGDKNGYKPTNYVS